MSFRPAKYNIRKRHLTGRHHLLLACPHETYTGDPWAGQGLLTLSVSIIREMKVESGECGVERVGLQALFCIGQGCTVWHDQRRV